MKAKYDNIGINYNETRKADPFLVERLFYHLAPTETGQYLDIGCGTGNYTIALNQKSVNFIGIDPSNTMLKIAKLKNKKINWVKGSVENILLSKESIDGIIGSLTIHHWTDLSLGFKELNRVLKKDGTMTLFTATPKQMKGYWLNHYFPKMLKDSTKQMPTYESIKAALTKSNFKIIETEKYFIQPDLEDLFLYSGKHNPKLYLKEKIRKGISSFSALANLEEVTEGLKKLAEDIASKKVYKIIKHYENEDGDYLFIKAALSQKQPKE